jgi:hypothetical protein
MNVPASRPEPEDPNGGKWETIRYAIGGWGTTIRLLIVLLVISTPVYLIVVHLLG